MRSLKGSSEFFKLLKDSEPIQLFIRKFKMSTLLDMLTPAATSEPKAKAKKVRAKVEPTNLHDLVLVDYANAKGTNSASGAEWVGFKTLLQACEGTLKDANLYTSLIKDIREVFADLPEVARARVQYLNNARRVAYGGVIGSEQKGSKQAVSGRGWAMVEEVLSECDSFRSFKTSIASAVPSALKKAKSQSTKAASTQHDDNGVEMNDGIIAEFADAKSAFAAAINLLKLVDRQLVPSADHELIMSLHATVKALERKLAA